jgi:Flp pilus assembly protein TadD
MLLAATAFAYRGLVNNEFVSVDDETYLTNNPPVVSGLTWPGVKWAFTTFHASNWHPLTWLSLMASCDLFGTWPVGHHFVNELLHLANVALLFFLMVRMTDRLAASAFVAGMFAVHPLHVESVAWLAERKDVLSGLFFFLTLHAYVSYSRRRNWRWMTGVVVLYALGLMSKPMLVTTPFVMLLLDYWPLARSTDAVATRTPSPGTPGEGRGEGSGHSERLPQIRQNPHPTLSRSTGRGKSSLAQLVIEKIPLFLLAAACSVITLLAQRHAMMDVRALPIGLRIENAIVSIPRYMLNAIWPTRLYYGYPLRLEIPLAEVVTSALLLLIITALAIRMCRRLPALFVGWFWFIGMLVPVLGLIQVGGVSMADRYMYLPMIGLSTAVAFSIDALVKRRAIRISFAAIGSVALIALTVMTSIQVSYWRNSVALFGRALQLNPDNFIVEHNYARALLMAGRGDEAIAAFQKLVDRYPKHVIGWKTLAMADLAKGDLPAAAQAIEPALALDQTDPELPFIAAFIAMKQQRTDDAIALYRRTIELHDNIVAHYELGRLLLARDPKSATDETRRAIALADPNDSHVQMANRLLAIGALDEAQQSLYLDLAFNGILGPEEQSAAEAKRGEIEARCATRLGH